MRDSKPRLLGSLLICMSNRFQSGPTRQLIANVLLDESSTTTVVEIFLFLEASLLMINEIVGCSLVVLFHCLYVSLTCLLESGRLERQLNCTDEELTKFASQTSD